MSTPTIHVVGGGIGGLAVAVALHRRGFDVQVHEAAPSYAHVGGGHWLYANALHALDAIAPGLRHDMVALGRPFEGFRFATQQDRTLFFETTAPYTPRPELAPVVLHRADIIDQLARRLPAERLHFGRRLARCEAQALVFDDGTRIEAAIILGADGIHSRVRQDRISQAPARFAGQTGIWGISDHHLPEGTAAYFTELWGDGVRLGFTYVGAEGVYWFVVVRGRDVPDDPHARKAFVLEQADGFPSELVEAIRQTAPGRMQTNPLYDLSPPRRWSSGTACCLGDAVHACTPNLGQGGCQALEDAVVLAERFADQPDVAHAFRAFERQRRRKATAVVYPARWLGALAQGVGPRSPRSAADPEGVVLVVGSAHPEYREVVPRRRARASGPHPTSRRRGCGASATTHWPSPAG